MTLKKMALPLLIASMCAAGPAFAQAPAFTPGWYVGVGAGQAKLDTGGEFDGFPGTFDDTDTSFTVRLGNRFHRNLAVEIGYYHLGDYDFHASEGGITLNGTAEARSFGVSLVAIAPLDRLDLYGRVGYARSEAKVKASVAGFSAADRSRENEFFGGVGLRWHVARNLGVFAEYQTHDKLEVNAWFVGVDFRF